MLPPDANGECGVPGRDIMTLRDYDPLDQLLQKCTKSLQRKRVTALRRYHRIPCFCEASNRTPLGHDRGSRITRSGFEDSTARHGL